VTRDGGFVALESLDGKTLYYTKTSSRALWSMPVRGGEERQVVPSVLGRVFAVTEQGIYYVALPKTRGGFSLEFFSFASQTSATVAPLNGTIESTSVVAVSPDGRNVLYTQRTQSGSDLMLIENFR
jgi:hypothetical protein